MPSRTEPPRHAEPALDPPRKMEESPASLAGVGWSVALTVIAILAVFFTLHAASSLFVPIAAAVLLSMLLAPPVQFLERLHVPRLAASAIVVAATVALIGAGLAALAGPAQSWIEKGPESLEKMEHKLFALNKPHKDATDPPQGAPDARPRGDGPQEVRVVQPALRDIVLSATPQAAASIISVTILVYFLLASGDVFLRKLVTVIPTLGDKKRAVEITRQIETDISFYLLSFTLVNVGLGVAMVVVTAVLGMPNPLLWGALVAVLNFVPYVGAELSRDHRRPFGLSHAAKGTSFILDMAMSVAARGKIRSAMAEGKTIPEGWATDAAGRPTTDPAEALKGFLLPIGGHKGYGLALTVDLFAGLLSGAAYLSHVRSWLDEPGEPQNLGHFFLLIDVKRLMPEAELGRRMTDFAGILHATPPADPERPVRLPGEIEMTKFRRRRAEGIRISAELRRQLENLAS